MSSQRLPERAYLLGGSATDNYRLVKKSEEEVEGERDRIDTYNRDAREWNKERIGEIKDYNRANPKRRITHRHERASLMPKPSLYKKEPIVRSVSQRGECYVVRGERISTKSALYQIADAEKHWLEESPNPTERFRNGSESYKQRVAKRKRHTYEWDGKPPVVPLVRKELMSIYNGIKTEHRKRFINPANPEWAGECIEWDGMVRTRDGAAVIKRARHDRTYSEGWSFNDPTGETKFVCKGERVVKKPVKTRRIISDMEYLHDRMPKKRFERLRERARTYPVLRKTERPAALRTHQRVDLLLKHHWTFGGIHTLGKGFQFVRTCGNPKCVHPAHIDVDKRRK